MGNCELMLVARNDMDRYIPQRNPFVMIDELLKVESNLAVTQLEVRAENLMVNDGYFSEPGMIETIAQTAAAHAGYLFVQKNLPVPIGYIASIKNLSISNLAKVGSILKTTVRIVNQVLNVTIAEGEVTQGDQILCQCEIRIFINEV